MSTSISTSAVRTFAAAKGGLWEHPGGYQDRFYLPPEVWAPLAGLEVVFYNSGNVAKAWRDGERISNGDATRLLSAKVWVGAEDGLLYVGRDRGTRLGERIEEAIIERAEAQADIEPGSGTMLAAEARISLARHHDAEAEHSAEDLRSWARDLDAEADACAEADRLEDEAGA